MTGLSKEELLKENEALVHKVDDLSAKLLKVNGKLKESEALKGHFISNITNEIINPFSSVLAHAQNIQTLKDNELGRAKKMAAMIYAEAFHLDFQLKNILAAATIEAGTEGLKLTSVNLKGLVNKVVDFFERQIDSKKIRLNLLWDENVKPEVLVSFISDEDKLLLMMKNLLDNAIKFSPENGVIDFHLSVKERKLIFCIQDQGKGIPADKKQEIFDRFKQLDNCINSLNTGYGLGLSIVWSYLNLLEGQLRFIDYEGSGTRIELTVPELEKNNEWDDLDEFLIDPEQTF